MSSRYNSSKISDISDKKIFLDANILIYLFWASTSSTWENQYAKLYSNLTRQGNQFVVDFVVVSEFVNRAIKIQYENYLQSNGIDSEDWSYKSYRDSKDGQEALDEIYLTLKEDILKEFEVAKMSYSKNDLMVMCSVDSLDFSDKAIVTQCRENGFVLLTNDKDFKDSDIDILSCHRDIA